MWSLLALIATVALMASFVPVVEAVPQVVLIFGPADSALAIAVAIIAAFVAVMAKWIDFGALGAGRRMSAEDHESNRQALVSFFKAPGWALMIAFIIALGLSVVALAGYIQHVFEDASGTSIVPAPPDVFATWFTWIWALHAGSIAFTKIALDFYHDLSYTWFAVIVSAISFAGFAVGGGFTIAEMVQLPTGTQMQWEYVTITAFGVWFLLSAYMTGRYVNVAYNGSDNYKQL